MKYVIKSVDKQKDLDNMFNEILSFCKLSIYDTIKEQMKSEINLSQTITNMAWRDWKINNECLLYRMFIKKKYGLGEGVFSFIYDNDKLVGISGAEVLNPLVGSMEKRVFVLSPYRRQNFVTEYFMPEHMRWFKDNYPDMKLYIITFNEYNKERHLKQVRMLSKRPDFGEWNIWVKWNYFSRPLIVHNTLQYIMYYTEEELTEKEIERMITNDI